MRQLCIQNLRSAGRDRCKPPRIEHRNLIPLRVERERSPICLILFARRRIEDAASVRLNALPPACQGAADSLRAKPRSRRYGRVAALLGGVLATALLIFPPSANASYDPLASGTTKLTLDPGFQHLLASHGVALLAAAPASRSGAALVLPVVAGAIDPTTEQGEIDTEGALVFQRGARQVPLREIVVKTKPEPLVAKVGGGQLKLATAAKRSFARAGFGSSFAARPLRLTAKLATRLDKKLRLPGVFMAGQLLGTLRATAKPATTAILPTASLSLALDPAFLAKLDSLFVSANPISPAELAPGPTFTLPFIPAGTIAPDAGTGVPRSGGSLEFLQLGAGQIFWHELWFDLANHQVLAEVDEEPTPTFPGKLGQIPVASLDLSSAAIVPNPKARTVAVTGAGLALNVQSAATFNEAFAKPQDKAEVFHAGETFAAVSFAAQTQ
jgi:hypothetical protein